MPRRLLVAGLCLILAPSAAWAAAKAPGMPLYRYIDSRGVKVLDSQGVPAEYVGKGYEVLNQQGRVIQVVAPAPTADELARTQAERAQAAADQALLKKYPSLAELERARARKQLDLDGTITLARNNQQALLIQQQLVQSQAAEQERAGRPVPQAMIDQLKELRAERDALEGKIRGYQQAKVQAEQDFAVLKVRLVPLLGQ
jgi:hypothetical protein